MRARLLAAVVLCSACGGGGGGGTGLVAPVRLAAADVEIGPASTGADLLVQLAEQPAPGPALLQVAIELPSALAIASGAPLLAAQPLVTLQGQAAAGRFVVVCGDDQNRSAAPLQTGPLFRLRLATRTPRQTGTFQITLRELRAAQSDGSAAGADVNPAVATVTVR